jgi:acyl dehydratase
MSQDFPASLALICGPVTAIDLALFAAASGDHNPLHLDVDVAHAAGFDRPVVHGMLAMAYAARMFTQHFGPGAVRKLHTRFTGVAMLGHTIAMKAWLVEVAGGIAHYELIAHNDAGVDLVNGSAYVQIDAPKMYRP